MTGRSQTPGGQDDDAVRDIIAEIDHQVQDMPTQLVPDLQLPPTVLAFSS